MVAIEFITFVRERLHVHDALQALFDDRRRVSEAILRIPGNLARLPAENYRDRDHQWQAQEHDARQLQRGDCNQRNSADQ